MKKLESVSITRLTHLEFGQHIKSLYSNIAERGSAGKIQDTTFTKYLKELNAKSLIYDKAMLQIAKSDETAKITQADDRRDKALTCIQRYLSVFEFSPYSEHLSIFASLNTLFDTYKGLQTWNYEEQSNGIDNLIDELQSQKYATQAASIGMIEYISRLAQTNRDFKAIFNARTQEQSSKEVFDVKELRNDLKTTYEKLINYVWTMSTAVDTKEFNESLNIINTVRKYYSDMLAKRNHENKTTSEIPDPSVN